MNPAARRPSRLAPAIAVALIAGALLATPTAPGAAATSTATGSTEVSADQEVALSLAPGNSGVVAPGADLAVTAEIVNSGASALGDGTVEVVVGEDTLADDAALRAWLDGTDGSALGASAAASGGAGAIGPGVTHGVALTVPAARLGLDGSGVYPVSASLVIGGSVVSTARTTVVVGDPAAEPGASDLTLIAPITSIPSSTGLIQGPALEAFTADDGMLTRELDAVAGRPVTIAVDPRIIVSIRALGSTAPESAVEWLERLDAAPNPVIPLTFGDSDIAGERQAGAEGVLTPTSFSYALDAADFVDVDDLIEPTAGTPTPTSTVPGATDAPTPTPAAAQVPTTEQLLDWDYTTTSVAWPRSGTVTAGDLPFITASGYDTTIVDSTQLGAADGGPLGAAGNVEGQRVLVSDAEVSAAVQAVTAATSEPRRGQAAGELSAALWFAAESGSPVLAVLDRTTTLTGGIDQVLAAVGASGWARPAPLDALLAAPADRALTLTDAPESEERVARISSLLDDSRSIDAFSSILSDPSLLTGRQRADLLALLSNSWITNEGGWNVAVETARSDTRTTLDAVQVVDGSSINMVANQANLPVTVSNQLPYPVTVSLRVTPSNGRLVVEKSDVEVTIEAESRKGAQIPLEAGVANGPVLLNMQVVSPTGVLISLPSPVLVNVSADWETWGTVIVAALVVGVFGFGIVRNILQRRRRRREAAVE